MGLVSRLEVLYQRMKEAGVTILTFEAGPQEKFKIRLKGADGERGSVGDREIGRGENPSEEAKHSAIEPGLKVIAPLSGVFYRAPSPSSPAFVEEGSAVKSGDILCIIEAMKVLNEIRAPKAGKVLRISGVNGKHVKKGETIFVLRVCNEIK